MKTLSRFVCLVLIFGFSSVALAAWDATAKVVNIEPSYMPEKILFKLDVAAGDCAAGEWIWYHGNNYNQVDSYENVKSVYAGILAASITGKRVEVHGNDHCVAVNVHTMNQ